MGYCQRCIDEKTPVTYSDDTNNISVVNSLLSTISVAQVEQLARCVSVCLSGSNV